MKKVYLTGAVFAFSSLVMAQTNNVQQNLKNIEVYTAENGIHPITAVSDTRAEGDVILADDFSTPANWTNTVDANGNQWTVETTTPANIVTYMGPMASTSAANGFGTFDGITMLLNSAVVPADATIELAAPINCTGIAGVVLEFEQRYKAFNSDETIVEVSGDNGLNWTEYLVNEEVVTNAAAVQNTISINISAIAGNQNQVKVRFRWRELAGDPQFGSGYGWMVDDFRLIEAWNYEMALITPKYRMGVGLTYTEGMEYHYIPTSQIDPIEFSSQMVNNGGMIQAGANLTVDITGAGTFNASSPSSDIALLATDTFVVATAFTPSAIGTYNVAMTASQTNTENDITDNSFAYSFDVTDYTFGRDNGIEGGSITNIGGNTGLSMSIGNVMNVFGNGVVGALDIKITTDGANAGKIMFGAIYRLNAAGDGYDWLAQTNDYTIGNGDVGNFIKLVFDSPVTITTGEEILIVAGHYGDDVAFSTAQGTEVQTVLGFTDDGATLFSLSSPSAVMIRADLRDFSSVEELTASNITVSQNVPNPFTNNSVITYNLNETANVSVQIIDVTGKVVATIDEGNQAAGEHNITIDGSTLAEGTYFYTFTAGTYQVTKRMVVSK